MGRMEPVGKIGESRTLRVSVRGGGYYLYLPRDVVEVYGILAGDRVEVKLGRIYRPKIPEEEVIN